MGVFLHWFCMHSDGVRELLCSSVFLSYFIFLPIPLFYKFFLSLSRKCGNTHLPIYILFSLLVALNLFRIELIDDALKGVL